MRTHVKVVAALFFVFSAVGVLMALFSSLFFGALASFVGAQGDDGAPLGAAILGFTGLSFTIILLALSIPGLVCGWGLLRFRRWARILAIVLAAISLLRIPLGTAFGVYALWVLFNKQTEVLFAE
jgi:hypothetical protein